MSRLILSLIASAIFCVPTISSAATVTFLGTFSAGGPGVLGEIPNPDPMRPYSLTFNFLDNQMGTAPILSGSFNVDPLKFDVTSGLVLVNNAGTNDSSSILLSVGGPSSGTININLGGDAISNNDVTTENLYALLAATVDPQITFFDAGSGNSYSGNITGVPEPGSCFVLISLVAAAGFHRKRIKLATQP